MDILQEFEKNQPKAQLPSAAQTLEQLLAQRYAPDTGFFVRLVMRFSGGRIQNTRQANFVLFMVAAVVLMISALIFIWPTSSKNSLPDNFLKIDQSRYINNGR